MTHICVCNLTIIGSDNGLSPGRRQAIIWTNAGILLIEPLGTNFSEILAEIITFSFKKMYMQVSSGKWRPFCLGLNVLNRYFSVAKTTETSYFGRCFMCLFCYSNIDLCWQESWRGILGRLCVRPDTRERTGIYQHMEPHCDIESLPYSVQFGGYQIFVYIYIYKFSSVVRML